MWRDLILAAGLFACLIPAGTFAQQYRKTVTVEVYLPEGARLFIEGQETRPRGPMQRFVSPPLPPGARVISVAHRMADVKPDEQIVVDTELGEFDVYLWKAETLRGN